MNAKIRKRMLECIFYHIDGISEMDLSKSDVENMSDEDLRDLALMLSINLD